MPVTLDVGQTFALPTPERLDSARIAAFAQVGGDDSPAHLNDAQAQAVGFPRALAHGMLGMALLGRLLTETFPDATLLQFSSRFVAMTFHDDLLICTATVATVTDATASFTLKAVNQDDTVVLTGAAAMSFPR